MLNLVNVGARIVLALALVLASGIVPTHAAPAGRGDEPVVLTGAAVPSLQGLDPTRIVAFRIAGGWMQVPVQIDERAVVDFGQIYNDLPSGFTVLTYTDAGTFTGPDSDSGFDADDELVFMAASTGLQWTGGPDPAGTVPGSLVEVRVRDPLDNAESWLYLFESDGSLDPAAGAFPIPYTFNLLSGDYTQAEVAFMVGFSDQSNFARAFKRWTGMSPGEFQSAA